MINICYLLHIFSLLIHMECFCCFSVLSRGCVERSDKTLQSSLSFISLVTFYLYFAFYHKRKDPVIKRTSYLESQGMITYTPVLTLSL
jgi:hypothetical protein